ncbi:MAG: DUF3619 family protein [Variovorax sp.]
MPIAYLDTESRMKVAATSTNCDQFGGAIAAYLSAAVDALPEEHLARLESARHSALVRRKNSLALPARCSDRRIPSWLTLSPRSMKVASVAPALALAAGLWLIDAVTREKSVNEIAEVELRLLVSKLPLAAYTDPGFAEFVRRERPVEGIRSPS